MNQAQVKTSQAAQRQGSLGNTISPLSGWRSVVDKMARESFIAAMRNAATGVNVVTTDGAAGRYGITVSAFASVSAEPLTVLVCINRDSVARDAILANGRFCVNVLSAGQTDVAKSFAGCAQSDRQYDFSIASWRTTTTGSPALDGCAAWFDCSISTAIDVGTHTIFIGEVGEVDRASTDPLLYNNRSYRRLGHAL